VKAPPVVPKLMIMDACVLIDFLKTDASVLRLIAKHVGPVYVLNDVVQEVNQIETEEELTDLGLSVVEPTIDDAYAAASAQGPTSFQDRLCMLTAKRHGLLCITNDTNLRKLCKREGVPLLWGLEVLAKVHREGGIPSTDALAIAQAIRKSNPKHITPTIIASFTSIVRRQESSRHRP
jgi:predicted nucleic acid-binding protein